MKTVKASEFKSKCLALMDEVARNGSEIVVTKNGKPISRLVPYVDPARHPLGLHKGQFELNDDLVAPTDELWDVEH